jgi:hypothetical protein
VKLTQVNVFITFLLPFNHVHCYHVLIGTHKIGVIVQQSAMVVHKIELLNVVIPWMTPFIKDDWLIHSYVLMKYQPVVKLAMKIHVPHIIGTLVNGPLAQLLAMVALNPRL